MKAHLSIPLLRSPKNGLKQLFLSAVFLLFASFVISPDTAACHEEALQVVAPWEVTSADPATSGVIFQRMEVIETLTNVAHDGILIPGLATQWEMSQDGLLWTFRLRNGVKFHDGSDLTAEAAENALQTALTKPGMLQKLPIKQITHNGNMILISLHQQSVILPSALSHYTTAILAPTAYKKDGSVLQTVGTGPYMITAFEPPQKIKVQAFDDYWAGRAKVNTAQYLAVSRNETRGLMAQSGDADIAFTLDPATMRRLERFKRLSIVSTSIPRTIVIKVNCALPGLDSAELRRALSEGLDRKGLALAVMQLDKASANQLFPESLGYWHLNNTDSSGENTTHFKELLQSKGWTENTSGILEKDGKPFELTITTYSDRQELPVAATALQDQLRKMGIKLNVSITNSSAIPQGHQEGTLELGLLARNYGLISDPLGSILIDYGPEGGDWGAMNWSNDQMQKELKKLQETSDPKTQGEYIRSISRILHNEMPTIPLVSYQHSAALSNELEGFSLDPLERSYRISELSWRK